MKNLLPALMIIGYSSLSLAQSAEPEYFLDHLSLAPGETKTVAYAIPTSQHFLQCNQESFGSYLSSIEWKYKQTSFKGQIGNYHMVTLIRDDLPPYTGDRGQVADTSGELVITNLDQNTAIISCRYSLTTN
jgi:hypothetical protein